MTAPSPGQRALNEHTGRLRENSRKKIEKALREMRKSGSPINVQAVADRAGVSRMTVYRHEELCDRVIALRDATAARPTLRPLPDNPQGTIDAALRRELAGQKAQNTELKTQVRQRDQQIAALHGEVQRLKQAARAED